MFLSLSRGYERENGKKISFDYICRINDGKMSFLLFSQKILINKITLANVSNRTVKNIRVVFFSTHLCFLISLTILH